jgi:MFS family permease
MPTPKDVQRTYIILILTQTLAASFIWGVNTLFLLDAGLSNTAAFAANAFFTVGQVVFEVPTGVVADTWGRRISYILGAATLLVSTLLYLYLWHVQAGFVYFAGASLILGLGFTFFSGAVEAWLVDCLNFTGYKGALDDVFAKGQIVTGIAMLSGSVAGGVIAQFTNLGVPYILRSLMLITSIIAGFILMKDLGFKPDKSKTTMQQIKAISRSSIDHGIRNNSVRWVMLAGPFAAGVGFYAFYAMQPYLLELWGDSESYAIAGLAAAIVAGAQVVGGLSVKQFRKIFSKRTHAFITGALTSAIVLVLIGVTSNFWVAIALLVIWAIVFSAVGPMRQAYMNGCIPSKQRATVLSFDAMISSTGGVVGQPALGKVADAYSYSASYLVSGVVQLGAIPFFVLANRINPKANKIPRSSSK